MMVIPLLSVYLLSITCSVGNFSSFCCEENIGKSSHEVHNSFSSHSHPEGHPKSNGAHSNKKTYPHAGDCCTELTTNFFSIFQAQPVQFVLQNSFTPDNLPLTGFGEFLENIINNQTRLFIQIHPPPKKVISGQYIRILYKSFLN